MRRIIWQALFAAVVIFPSLNRLNPIGADSYTFLPYTFGIPLPILLFTGTLCFILLAEVLARNIGIKDPFLASLCLAGAPYWVLRMNFFENDFWGVLFCLAATICFIKFCENKRSIHLAIIMILVSGIASILWNGIFLFLLLWFVYAVLKLPVNKLMKGILGGLALGYIMPKPYGGVGEMALGLIFVPLALCLTFVFGQAEFRKTYKDLHPFMLSMCLVFGAVGFAVAKFLWLAAIPFAFLTSNHILVRKQVVPILFFMGILLGWQAVMYAEPTPDTMLMASHVAGVTEGSFVANDWDYGYWLLHEGATPLLTPAHPREINKNDLEETPWVLSRLQEIKGDVEYCYAEACLYNNVVQVKIHF